MNYEELKTLMKSCRESRDETVKVDRKKLMDILQESHAGKAVQGSPAAPERSAPFKGAVRTCQGRQLRFDRMTFLWLIFCRGSTDSIAAFLAEACPCGLESRKEPAPSGKSSGGTAFSY